jgi:hypothetical protein
LFVAAILVLGIYVSSALLILYFMIVLGEFRWRAALPFALGAALLAFVVFERWFLVALPKGRSKLGSAFEQGRAGWRRSAPDGCAASLP